MAHDVFISYSSKDKTIADAICATMEHGGVRCWIAPRDILPGSDWSGSIVQAIAAARVFVLVLSGSANASNQIKREVERAVHVGLPVIPYRIEDVVPSESLEYFLSTPHWLDAFTPPVERHAQYLTDVVRRLLQAPSASPPDSAPSPSPTPAPPPPRPPSILKTLLRPIPLAGGVVAIAVAIVLALLFGRPPSFVGAWTSSRMQWAPSVAAGYNPITLGQLLGAALGAGHTSGTFNLNVSNGFRTVITVQDSGTVQRVGSGLVFTSATRATAPVAVQRLADATSIGARPGEDGLVLQGAGRLPEPWVGRADPAADDGPLAGIVGVWRNGAWPTLPDGESWTGSLSIDATGGYKVELVQAVGGVWTAKNGKWSTTVNIPSSATPVPGAGGDYQFSGADQVTTTSEQGTTVWVRSK